MGYILFNIHLESMEIFQILLNIHLELKAMFQILLNFQVELKEMFQIDSVEYLFRIKGN